MTSSGVHSYELSEAAKLIEALRILIEGLYFTHTLYEIKQNTCV